MDTCCILTVLHLIFFTWDFETNSLDEVRTIIGHLILREMGAAL